MTQAGNSQARRVAVVTVHGVGNNAPGSTVNSVVDAICTAPGSETSIRQHRRIDATPENHVYMFAEPASDWQHTVEAVHSKDTGQRRGARSSAVSTENETQPLEDVPRFPVYARQAALPNGGMAEFYELHWADLARADGGWWDTVRSFARFVFEIPHVIDGFLRDPPGPHSRFLRRLLLLATCFVRGPLAGYTAVMLVGGLIFLAFSWIPERENVAAMLEFARALVYGVVASILGERGSLRLDALLAGIPSPGVRSMLLGWLGGGLVFALLLAWVGRHSLRLRYLAAFIGLTCALYLADALWMRPTRYLAYEGLVYLDFMSICLFAFCITGVYMFVTRRTKEVGFADLGLFIALWSAFFIAHMSVPGDLVREMLFGGKPYFETSVKTASSAVYYKAFEIYYPILAYLWVIWASLMLAAFAMAFILYAFNWRVWDRLYRGVFVAVGLAVLQSCVWLTAIPGLGVMHMNDVLCGGSTSYASLPRQQPVTCQAKLDVNARAVDLFMNLTILDEQAKAALPLHLREEISRAARERFRGTLHFDMLKALQELALAFIWNGFMLISAAALAILVGFYRHQKAAWFGRDNRPVRLPRLIINRGVLAFLLAFGLANITFAFYRLEAVSYGPLDNALASMGLARWNQREVPAEVIKMAIMTTTLFLLVTQVPSINRPLSGVLQIMQGLIDHHYRVGVSLAPRLFAKRRDVPVRRDHITQRLHEIVQRLIVGKGYDDVIFVSHSQGSVIVYDYLSSAAAKDIGKPVHVVTAGSPLGALYAYYFNEYDRIEERIGKLGPMTASWTNLYRLDDPIAGPIAPRSSSARRRASNPAPPPPFLLDEQLPPGGHLRYWREPVVCDTIRNLLLGRPPRSTP